MAKNEIHQFFSEHGEQSSVEVQVLHYSAINK